MVAVISKTGIRLMPTKEYRARRLLKNGKAVIEKYHPFTIRLTEREDGDVQPIEYACDTGYQHVGVSIKSEKNEYVHAQFDMLQGETERHNDCRKYRRDRRNRKRYRALRFDNRKKPEGWLAPSLRHRVENQIRIFETYNSVMPITSAAFEMGQFDTQLLKAVEEGSQIPEGTDYQRGEQYLYETVRKAVFGRDNYTCQICGKSVSDGAILHTHHIGFWKGYRSNRVGNLLTVCEKCHTAKNHKPNGRLWGIEPKSNMVGAAYMNAVRWQMYNTLKERYPEIELHIQYGAKTPVTRKSLNIAKSHANDAYCIGTLRPKHQCREEHYVKRRRNNRVLSKFYDAKYIDIRDGKKRSGSQLSCGRTNRREPRNTEKNERIYRGQKVSKGQVRTRTQHYTYQPGDIVLFQNEKCSVIGTHCKGNSVKLSIGRSITPKHLNCISHAGAYKVS